MEFSVYRKFISNRIYQLRIEKDLSARELSLSLGMSPGYINKIENNRTMLSLDALFEICLFFGITPKEFFDGD